MAEHDTDQNNLNQDQPQTAPEPQTSAAGTNVASQFRDRAAREQKGETLELTSGITVTVRRPSITNMVRSGVIPGQLAGAALKYDKNQPMSERDVQRLFEMKQIVVKHALVTPRVVEDPNYDNNEIAFTDLNEDEINDIYMYVQVGLVELTKFRTQRSGDAAGSDSSEVPGN